jgi:hypothetical protein
MSTPPFLAVLLLLLTRLPALVSAQANFDNFEGFGKEPKFCQPYKCQKDHEPVPKWPLKLSSVGCSGMGGMQVFGAGDLEDDPQGICCDLRHACIQTCGSLKHICDEDFIKCSKKVCEELDNEEKKKKCESSASIHELMVKMDQCQRYDTEQYSHCECAPSAEAPKKRERILRQFYKKFNPDSIEKVPGLVKKADNVRKFAGLLVKLYEKYPQVIKKIKDPQQEMMEKMMREARVNKDEDGDSTGGIESDGEDLGVDEL